MEIFVERNYFVLRIFVQTFIFYVWPNFTALTIEAEQPPPFKYNQTNKPVRYNQICRGRCPVLWTPVSGGRMGDQREIREIILSRPFLLSGETGTEQGRHNKIIVYSQIYVFAEEGYKIVIFFLFFYAVFCEWKKLLLQKKIIHTKILHFQQEKTNNLFVIFENVSNFIFLCFPQ